MRRSCGGHAYGRTPAAPRSLALKSVARRFGARKAVTGLALRAVAAGSVHVTHGADSRARRRNGEVPRS